MERSPRAPAEARQLLELAELLQKTAQVIADEWSKEDFSGANSTARILPSLRLHEAQRTVLAVTGAVTELVAEPAARVQEVTCEYFESRALFIAAERRIADLLGEAGEDGLTASEIAEATGIDARKLSRILRCLCSIHVFREIGPDRFANNRISAALHNNEGLRAYVQLSNLDIHTASDHLPKHLLSSQGSSYKVDETPWQLGAGTKKSRWDWLAERVSLDEIRPKNAPYPGIPDISHLQPGKDGLYARPELEIFALAMVGGGRASAAAHAYDYPWAELGEALVVDVGGGVGGFVLQLLPLYPNLTFIIQDRAEAIKQAREEIWPREAPESLANGRVSFMEHDFFEPNPVKGADVYWLRTVLHDWSDTYFTRILLSLKSSMSETSRILICDQIMNTTFGSSEIEPAPEPLPANYGYYMRYAHQRDLTMMSIINGIERTPGEVRGLVEGAGLRVLKIWSCRSLVGIVEVGL